MSRSLGYCMLMKNIYFQSGMLGFGYMGRQGKEGRHLSSWHSLLPSALSTPHPNKQNVYITIVLFFLLYTSFQNFCGYFPKPSLFNIHYIQELPTKMFFLIIFRLAQQWKGPKRIQTRNKGLGTSSWTANIPHK